MGAAIGVEWEAMVIIRRFGSDCVRTAYEEEDRTGKEGMAAEHEGGNGGK